MDDAKHTPGPWGVRTSQKGLPAQIVAPNESTSAPGKVGTSITRWGSISLPSSDEGQANARLIAAAPDLLAALDGLVSSLEPMVVTLADGTVNAIETQEVAAARAAIAKARGK
jgi:hypothetical protein